MGDTLWDMGDVGWLLRVLGGDLVWIGFSGLPVFGGHFEGGGVSSSPSLLDLLLGTLVSCLIIGTLFPFAR